MLTALKQRARRLKSELTVLYHAYRDPRTPLAAKLVMVLVLAYPLSPIDLIPDFIPVLGYLDDLLLLPLGITLNRTGFRRDSFLTQPASAGLGSEGTPSRSRWVAGSRARRASARG